MLALIKLCGHPLVLGGRGNNGPLLWLRVTLIPHITLAGLTRTHSPVKLLE